MLKDDKRRADLIATLQAIVTVAPAKPAAALPLAPDSLGAQLIVQVSSVLSNAGTQVLNSLHAVNDLPLLWRWVSGQVNDPDARARILETVLKLAAVLLAALAAERGTSLALRRLRAVLSQGAHRQPTPVKHEPEESGLAAAEAGETEGSARQHSLTVALSALRRLPYLVGRLLLDLIPIALFAVVGNGLLSTGLGEPALTRLVIVAVIEAYVAARIVLAVTAMLVTPASPRLRLLQVSDWAAGFLTRWTGRITVVVLAGYSIAEVGLLFGMYRSAYEALLKLFSLVVHIFLVVAVLQARSPVARRIRARRNATGMMARLRNSLAEIWHLIAIFYIVALWVVWAVELRNGYVRLVGFFLETAAVIIAARLVAVVLLGGLDRLRLGDRLGERHPSLEARAQHYYPIGRGILMVAIGVATVLTLLQVWGFDSFGWLSRSGLGSRSLSAILLIGITAVVAIVVWESANVGIELHLSRLSNSAQVARAGRLRTLLPMLRTILLVVIVSIVVLTVLSEIGVNTAPLLAGAGVVGIAVGFGSQRLVQDLITGLFLLLENSMQVGDVVALGGLSGTVEALSIRTIRLRAVDGSVHLIPFSAVTTVTNQTRDYSYAVLDLSIGLNEEPPKVIPLVRDVVDAMRAEPRWSSIIIDSAEVMGVEKFIDLAWVLRVRVKTQASSRWSVMRELNQRVKLRFDAEGIESPFTSHVALSTIPTPPAPSQPVPNQEKPA